MRAIYLTNLVWLIPFALVVYALVEIADQEKALIAETCK